MASEQVIRSTAIASGRSQFCYQEQDCSLTLREGLDEYYAANPGLFDTGQASSPEMSTYLKNHDVSHVVFGTTTSMADEALQDLWTFLAIDVPKKTYVLDFLQADEAKILIKSLKLGETIQAIAQLLVRLPGLLVRSRQMVQQWPWQAWDCYLDQPLADIRREFNIRLL